MKIERPGFLSGTLALLLSLFVVLLFACQRGEQREKTELLSEAGRNERNFSSYKPANAYEEAGKGVLARTVYDTTGPQGLRIQVRDLLVAPGQATERVFLPGAAVLEVRSGSGSIVIREKREEIASGKTLSVSEGESFVVENKTALPVVIRTYLFMSR